MQKAVFILSAIFISASIWGNMVSCGSAGAASSDDSPLTVLMRKMEKDMQKVKKKVEKGKSVGDIPDWNEMYGARSSKPGMDTTTYNAFAYALLASAENLEKAAPVDQPKVFNATVDVCMSCHTQMCPGPKVRIKKLYLPQ